MRPIARHIFEAGGKRLRPLLTILMARLLGYFIRKEGKRAAATSKK